MSLASHPVQLISADGRKTKISYSVAEKFENSMLHKVKRKKDGTITAVIACQRDTPMGKSRRLHETQRFPTGVQCFALRHPDGSSVANW